MKRLGGNSMYGLLGVSLILFVALVIARPASADTFVVPHVLEKSGTITNTQFTFDTTIFATYGSGIVDSMVGGGATVDLYLFDESEAPLTTSASGALQVVCNPCSVDLGGAVRRKRTLNMDDLIVAAGGFDEAVKPGYGVLVVGGADPDGVALQGFVVNSHTSPFDLSFQGTGPRGGGGGGGGGGADRKYVLPHVLEKAGRISNTQNTFDTMITATYTGGLLDGSRPRGATLELYLYEEGSGAPMHSAAGTDICNPCQYALDGSNRRESIAVESLIESAGGFDPIGFQTGYGIAVVSGADPGNVDLDSFVVNSHTSAFDVSMVGLPPDEVRGDGPSTSRTHVIPHVFDTKGNIATTPFTFDTQMFVTYTGTGGSIPGSGATVDVYLFDDATGKPMKGTVKDVCNPCSYSLGASQRRQRISLDALLEDAGGFDQNLKSGYAVVVIDGDSGNVSLQGFVVNSHSGPFELSVFGFEPQPISAPAPLLAVGAPRTTRSFVLPHVLEKSGRITNTQFTFDTTIFAVYGGGLPGGVAGPGATLDLYLYDDETEAPLKGSDGVTDVCNPCSFALSAQERKRTIVVDDLIEAAGGFDTPVKLGYGVIVVGGADPDGVVLQGFVVNSHTSAFDLDFLNLPLHPLSSAPSVPLFIRADPDLNMVVDLADAVYILGCLFLGTECPSCPDSADSNDDGEVDLADAVGILRWLFSGGEAPPAPGPEACGPEPGGDLLPECVYPRC